MKLRASTLERVEIAFAAAVAAGDHEAADGWITIGRYVADREARERSERASNGRFRLRAAR